MEFLIDLATKVSPAIWTIAIVLGVAGPPVTMYAYFTGRIVYRLPATSRARHLIRTLVLMSLAFDVLSLIAFLARGEDGGNTAALIISIIVSLSTLTVMVAALVAVERLRKSWFEALLKQQQKAEMV